MDRRCHSFTKAKAKRDPYSVRMVFLFFSKYKYFPNSGNPPAILCGHRQCEFTRFELFLEKKKEASRGLRKASCPHHCAQESGAAHDVEGPSDFFSMVVATLLPENATEGVIREPSEQETGQLHVFSVSWSWLLSELTLVTGVPCCTQEPPWLLCLPEAAAPLDNTACACVSPSLCV